MSSETPANAGFSSREAMLESGLDRTLDRTDFPALGAKYEGKVRDSYQRSAGDTETVDARRWMIVTDRLSAFDRVLGTVPFKGQVLNRLSAWWFEATKNVVPNHLIGTPDPNVIECVPCEPLPVEMVMRSYLTGTTSTSIWTHYSKGSRSFCGHALPDGMKKNQRLPQAILTPATKAPKGEHDVSGSREEVIAHANQTATPLDPADFDAAAKLAHALFAAGQDICAKQGLILVDTKYEFGKTKEGQIIVIDEIHTPDSSRFWRAETYDERFSRGEDPEPLDKDVVRRHYAQMGFLGDGEPPPMPREIRLAAASRYIEAYEAITGETFVPDLQEPLARIAKSLGIEGEMFK